MYMNVATFFGVVFGAVLCAQLVLAGIFAFVMTTDAYVRYTIGITKKVEKEMSKEFKEEEIELKEIGS